MVNVLNSLHAHKGPSTADGQPSSYSTYQEPDTKIPPKARSVFDAVTVDGVEIAESDILAEAQNHPAENPGAALMAAAKALVIRQLLLQKARSLKLEPTAQASVDGKNETAEDAAIRILVEQEVTVPSAGEAECLRFYENNKSRFRSEPIFEASHILIAADPADKAAREVAKLEADRLKAFLTIHPGNFAVLAREHSACPSGRQGGNLGQLTRGSTVAEFERALQLLAEGATTTSPVESRYGYHIIRLNRRVDGALLPFDLVRERIAGWLEAATWSKAVSQYIAVLAADSEITGIDILGADGPLVQ